MSIEVNNPLVKLEDVEKLSILFTDVHRSITCYMEDDDVESAQALLMETFTHTKTLLANYGKEAQAAVQESKLLRGKMVQMKLAASNLQRAAINFKNAAS